jgi:hypothetical protein
MRALVAAVAAFTAHPLHTTLTELRYREADRVVDVTVRAFAEDVRAAIGREVTDSAAFGYLRSTFTLTDRVGRPLGVAWCGLRRTDDVLWLCLRAAAPEGASGLRIRAGLLFDLYDDQINIVQVRERGRRTVLLFTRGDALKTLP